MEEEKLRLVLTIIFAVNNEGSIKVQQLSNFLQKVV